MAYKITQKIIKIGDSAGVTLPAKALKSAGLQPGDEVHLSFESAHPQSHDDIMARYEKFKVSYEQTLKNLADR